MNLLIIIAPAPESRYNQSGKVLEKNDKGLPMTRTALDPVSARTVWSDENVFIDPTSQVRVVAQPQSDTAMHRHRFTELVFVTAGTAIHAGGATERRLVTGDRFVMEGEWRHAYRKTKGLKLINVLIRNGCMERLRPTIRPLAGYATLFQERTGPGTAFVQPRTLTPHEMAECSRLTDAIKDESDRKADGCAAMQEALLLALLITLCRQVAGGEEIIPDARARIAKAIHHLEANFSEEVTLPALAKIAGMSARSLQRHFRTATGVTPMRYLLRARIATAARMLGETTLPVTEIAAECGMPDSAYFTRLFRQFTGTSPSNWRKRSHL